MIYFDNAATGGFKPRAVVESAYNVTRFLCANPGRSGHRLSLSGEKIIFGCRELIASMFNCDSDRVVFTKNCTEALNLAIFGTIKEGGHVITTTFEHNSVLRPLTLLEKQGLISLDIVRPTENKSLLEAIKEKINSKTYLIVMTAVSNVTGELLPIKKVGELAKIKNLLFLVDGAQGAGHIPINMKDYNISMLALPAHKGLYGIMGAGALLFDKNISISPIILGGTGNESFNLSQPLGYPERLESGTLALPAISAFGEGVRYVKDNIDNFSETLFNYTNKAIEGIRQIKGITCYSKPNRSGIVAISFDNIPSSEGADILNLEYDVAVRGGLHCAPLTHKYLNTTENGLIRVSFAVQNTYREINYFIKSIYEIIHKQTVPFD